jgi:hypothetical protein
VLLSVSPARMLAVLASVRGITMRAMRVMGCLFVVSSFMMFCRLAVMASGMRVMFGSGPVVLGCVL